MRRLVFAGIQPFWWRVSAFLVVMFFILLSDAILSDFVPGYIQDHVGTPMLMGIVMASSSVVGFAMDIVFPQLLRSTGVRNLAGMAMVGSLVFILSLIGSTWVAPVALILVGMAAWGVYYELDAFMTKQFVADAAPSHSRGAVWGVVGVFRNLAYFFGPLIGASLSLHGEKGILLISGAILFIAYLFFLIIKLPTQEGEVAYSPDIHAIDELRHWKSLASVAWPVLTMSLLAGIIDATFWTTGTVVNDMLAEQSTYGGWFLSTYMFPSLFVGFAIAKWGIYQGKKKWAEIFLLLGGAALMGITLVDTIWWTLMVVLISSTFFGLAWPLVDAVFSDFAVRMKRGRKHMIGMSSSILSLAYVIGPILAGYLATLLGELESFAYVGAMVVVVSVILLIFTPKKIRLPQQEIVSWDTVQ